FSICRSFLEHEFSRETTDGHRWTRMKNREPMDASFKREGRKGSRRGTQRNSFAPFAKTSATSALNRILFLSVSISCLSVVFLFLRQHHAIRYSGSEELNHRQSGGCNLTAHQPPGF